MALSPSSLLTPLITLTFSFSMLDHPPASSSTTRMTQQLLTVLSREPSIMVPSDTSILIRPAQTPDYKTPLPLTSSISTPTVHQEDSSRMVLSLSSSEEPSFSMMSDPITCTSTILLLTSMIRATKSSSLTAQEDGTHLLSLLPTQLERTRLDSGTLIASLMELATSSTETSLLESTSMVDSRDLLK